MLELKGWFSTNGKVGKMSYDIYGWMRSNWIKLFGVIDYDWYIRLYIIT